MELLRDLIIVLLSSVVVLFVLSRLKVPSVVGFILTGIVIGPYALQLVHATEEIEVMSEIGIMLLMFNIGLEFSLDKLKLMKKEVVLYGSLQMIITAVATIITCRFLGLTWPITLLASFVVPMSSTAITLKVLRDRNQLQTPFGRPMFGILLFQDIMVVPLIILTPLLGKLNTETLVPVGIEIGKSAVIIAVVFTAAKFILPRLFDFVLARRMNELLMMLVLSLTFGLSLFTNSLGFSLALGAFVMGMILAESNYLYQIESDLAPLRGIFLSVFFISVGMLFNYPFVIENWGAVLSATVGLITLKFLVILFIMTIWKNPINLSMIVGFGLAQIGEFAFILLNIARPVGFIPEETYQLFLSVSILSMMLSPLSFEFGIKLAKEKHLKKNVSGTSHAQEGQVIIAGYGINGLNLSRILKSLQIPYSIIEINPVTVKNHKKKGEPIFFGDLTKSSNLEHIGIEKARMLVIAISDPEATSQAVSLARNMNPGIHIIVRSEFITQIEPLYKRGADVVISQDFEASLEIGSYVLKHLGLASPLIRIKSEQLRKQHYSFFNETHHQRLAIAELAAVEKIHEAFIVLPDTKLSGMTLKEINLLPVTTSEVSIICIVRGEDVLMDDGIKIQAFDTLVLYGNQRNMDQAINQLENYGEWN